MNCIAINNRSKRKEPVVHLKKGGIWINGVENSIDYTICGKKIQKGLYTHWELTNKPVTCKRCLNV